MNVDAQLRGLYVAVGALLLAVLVMFGVQAAQLRQLTAEVQAMRAEAQKSPIAADAPPLRPGVAPGTYNEDDLARWWALVEGRTPPPIKDKGRWHPYPDSDAPAGKRADSE